MFYRFNAHRAKKSENAESNTDRLAKKIAGRITTLQQSWASFMDKHARRLSPKWLKAILLVFALGFGAYCMYLISGGMFTEASAQFENIKLRNLWPFNRPEDKQKLRRDTAWDHYLDSLQHEIKRDSLQNPQFYQP